jgi:tetratricopeptide (TPR) repeat protein
VIRRGGKGPAKRGHCLIAAALALWGGPATAALPMLGGPLVQLIDADTREEHTNVLVQFSCSVRYINNTPASHGTSTRITLRLGPDCGALLSNLPPEFPQIGGAADLLTGARVESVVPGEVLLEISWSREMDFVMAPTANGSGLRLRLYTIERKRATGAVLDSQGADAFSVNLDSSQDRFARDTVEAAAERFKTQAYVSEIDIDSEHWYRLRLGPFSRRADAEQALNAALAEYPRAWIAVNDEQSDIAPVEHAGTPTLATLPTDPALPDEERAKVLADARSALDRHQYPEAVELLTRLVRQPEYAARADAQELLGLARERAGQLAQAKAEYQSYLQRYPQGAGADRVRRRLQALAAASIAPRTFDSESVTPARWTVVGSTALGYQFDRAQTVTGGTTTSSTAVNAGLVYGDLLVRERGQRFDFIGRVDAGYTHNAASTVGGSQDRTTAAYAELTDRNWGLTGRIGRQTLASQGIIGLFDGLSMGYQINSHWSVSAAGGYPAYTSYSNFSQKQQFETVSAEYSPSLSLVFDLYLFNETAESFTDRRSVGFQTRFSKPGYTAIVLVDYDIFFRALNSATLIGNFKIGDHWIFGVNLDHRHSPLLELNNALIGQSATDLRTLMNELPTLNPTTTLKQLALDRTASSDTVVLSASRPLGERWQIMADVAALRLGATVASGNVPATPSTGVDKNGSLQLAGTSLLRSSDLHIFGLRYDDSPSAKSETVSWDARFPIGGAWRLGPRFSVARINDPQLGGRQTLYLPELRADWTSRRQVFEVIGGYQLQQQSQQSAQDQSGQTVNTSLEQRNLYVSATYRLRF